MSTNCKCNNRTKFFSHYLFTEEIFIYRCNECGKKHLEDYYISTDEFHQRVRELINKCRKNDNL